MLKNEAFLEVKEISILFLNVTFYTEIVLINKGSVWKAFFVNLQHPDYHDIFARAFVQEQ